MTAEKLQDSTMHYQIIYAISNGIVLFLHGTAAFLLYFLRGMLFTDNGRIIFVLLVPCAEFALRTPHISAADSCASLEEIMKTENLFDVCHNSGF